MKVFWRNGFSGISYADLKEAPGLNKSSLYNAFGDKDLLYLRCLERFAEGHGERLRKRLSAARLEDAVGGFFDELIGRFRRADLPAGCLTTGAALELGGNHDTAGTCIRNQMRELENLFHQRLDQAVRDGELPGDKEREGKQRKRPKRIAGLSQIRNNRGRWLEMTMNRRLLPMSPAR